MPLWLGIVLLVVVAALLGCVGMLLLRLRGDGRARLDEPGPYPAGEGRLAVLDSAPVDAGRRLLLVRCDDVEHLIMTGGPSDLVVEHDIGKRGKGARSGAGPMPLEASDRAAASVPLVKDPVATFVPAPEPVPAASKAAAIPGQMLAPEPQPRPLPRDVAPRGIGPRTPVAPVGGQPIAAAGPAVPAPPAQPSGGERDRSPAASPVVRGVQRSAPEAALSGARPAGQPLDGKPERTGETGGAARQRDHHPPRQRGAQNGAAQPNRREAPVISTSGHTAQATLTPGILARQQARRLANQAAAGGGPNAARAKPAEQKSEGGPPQPVAPTGLPVAEIPWPEPDGIEEEIVRALSVTPKPPLAAATPAKQNEAEPVAAPPVTDPGATLGDLADRLEQALAREVERHGPGAGSDFRAERLEAARPPNVTPARPAPEVRERVEPPRILAGSPEPDSRREARATERQEEAPVISLNTRRREPVDPLEDEMARLLGELTGDTTRR